jgi:hypothetical protein
MELLVGMTLDSVPATFTPAEAVAAGVARHAVYDWRDAGQIIEISRGVYRKADAATTAYLDLIAVAKRAPRGVVCLASALAVHELTDEIPSAVQMAVPNGVNVPRIAYPPTEFSRFDARTFDLGRTRFEAAPGEWVPVYAPERAVADAMRLRHRVGDDVALRALRAYLSRRDASAGKLAALARQLGDAGELLRAIQVVLS